MAECTHTDAIGDFTPSSTEGCSECLRSGDRWVHLRICLTCGEVGCCDSSPNRHASKHAAAAGHPLAGSFEPGEDWAWCYVDEAMLDASALDLPSHD
ncbi:MAG: UBP-type zinc finger domain-containing protein [Solirubrobacterales bacterium]|nr:UBP-type zinc finger domain-containing protein [Solirubrobacterales bacterium]